MKLTKVDGVAHYKEIVAKDLIGKLKTEKNIKEIKSCPKEMITNKIIETRFNAQIEGRIYNEFIRLNGKSKSYNNSMNDVSDKIKKEEHGVASLFMLLHELYTGNENQKWKDDILKINIENIGKIKDKGQKKYKIQYKLNMEKKQWLYRTKEEFDNNIESPTFQILLSNLQEEYKKNTSEIRELATFEKLKERFALYKKNKITKTEKSIKNNKFNLEIDKKMLENNIVAKSIREKYFLELFSEIIENISENRLDDTLKGFYCEKTEKLLDEIQIIFIKSIEFANEEKKEKEKKKNNKEKIGLEYDCDKIKANILNMLREYLKDESDKVNVGKEIYKSEIKKYILSALSKRKRNAKKDDDEKKEIQNKNLYFYLLKKLFFIDKEKNFIIKEKFQKKIEDNFKNIFSSHILNYGKLLHYSENEQILKNVEKIGTKELEYIKLHESLTRKFASLVSFGTYGIYNLLNHESDTLVFEDVVKSKTDFKKIKEQREKSSFSLEINKQKFNYFFDSSLKTNEGINLFDENKILDFVAEISQSIYDIRNGVIHFKNIKVSELDENSIIIDYFKIAKEKAIERIIEKFASNNLEYFFSEEEITYFFKDIYNYSLIKNKVSFAPSFKRVVSKGENLYRDERNLTNKDRYKWFLSKEQYGESEKSYLRAKNFLLDELYYNNFFKDFLSKESLFEEAVNNAKKRKSNSNKDSKSDGKSYEIIEKYKKSANGNEKKQIEEYLYNLHKLEMDRISNEKNDKFEGQAIKETSQFINGYIEDIFLEGFITWLDENYKNNNGLFLELNEEKIKNKIEKAKTELEEKKIILTEDIIKECSEFKNKLESELSTLKETKEVLRFYLFLSMIDNKKLNEFSNEIVKFRQFSKKINMNEKEEINFLGLSLDSYLYLCEFISLTRERLSSEKKDGSDKNLFERLYGTVEEEGTKKYDKILERFIDKNIFNSVDRQKELYYQTDTITPILFSQLETTRRFATQDFISKCINKEDRFKYSNKNDEEFISLEKNVKVLQEDKAKFHDSWKEWKKRNNKENLRIFKDNNSVEYTKFRKNVDSLRKYNFLKNKQNLQNIYEFHKIILELQSRNMAYINKYERDFKFLMLAIKNTLSENNEEFKTDIDKFLKGSRGSFTVGEYESKIQDNYKDFDKNLIKEIFCPILDERIRNYIAHFHHFTDSYSNRSEFSFIDQMNLLIKLFSYDKKTKNHINKSMKIILEKYGLNLKFRRTKETETEDVPIYEIDGDIKSMKGKLLGEDNILELHEKEFTEVVKIILEYKR